MTKATSCSSLPRLLDLQILVLFLAMEISLEPDALHEESWLFTYIALQVMCFLKAGNEQSLDLHVLLGTTFGGRGCAHMCPHSPPSPAIMQEAMQVAWVALQRRKDIVNFATRLGSCFAAAAEQVFILGFIISSRGHTGAHASSRRKVSMDLLKPPA